MPHRGRPVPRGMRVLKDADWTEPDDTWLAARFRAAGFVFVGKTNTPELATSVTTEPLAYGADPQPVGRDAQPRWLERRIRGRGRRRPGARRARQRHGRLHPVPGEHVRDRRSQADARPHHPRPRLRRVLGSAHPRVRADAFGARHGARCSTRSPARRPATRTPPHRRSVRTATSSTRATANGCASAFAPRHPTASRRGPTRCARSIRRRSSCRSRPRRRTRGDPRARQQLQPRVRHRHVDRGRARRRAVERAPGPRHHERAGADEHVLREDGRATLERRLPRRDRRHAGVDAARRAVVGRPRPPRGADQSRATGAARRARPDEHRPRRRRAHGPTRDLLLAVRRHRPAGDLACRCIGTTTGSRSACSSSPPTGGRTCCCASPHSSSAPGRGQAAAPRSTRSNSEGGQRLISAPSPATITTNPIRR